jgi:small-conductance mechanosensitive channel
MSDDDKKASDARAPGTSPEQREAELQSQQLVNMEQAAQATSDPTVIRRQARTAEATKVTFERRDKVLLAACGAALLVSLAAQWVISISDPADGNLMLTKVRSYLRGLALVTMIVALSRLVEAVGLGRVANPIARFNLRRVLRLVAALVVAFVVISVLFVNWYAAVVSLGLISLLLSFSLQTPISSFVGWIYILVRAPYRVGDRIRIGDVRGDVIDVSYLDTSLWEFRGEYLSTDHPTGRVIKFPNSMVFDTPVINFSWPLFPYVWNEIKFHIAYDADLDFVARTMAEVAETELGATMQDKVALYRGILAKTPVDHLEVQERPVVFFRVSDNTWLEAIARYLVQPKQAGRIKNRMTRNMLAALRKEPDRVKFPRGDLR